MSRPFKKISLARLNALFDATIREVSAASRDGTKFAEYKRASATYTKIRAELIARNAYRQG